MSNPPSIVQLSEHGFHYQGRGGPDSGPRRDVVSHDAVHDPEKISHTICLVNYCLLLYCAPRAGQYYRSVQRNAGSGRLGRLIADRFGYRTGTLALT